MRAALKAKVKGKVDAAAAVASEKAQMGLDTVATAAMTRVQHRLEQTAEARQAVRDVAASHLPQGTLTLHVNERMYQAAAAGDVDALAHWLDRGGRPSWRNPVEANRNALHVAVLLGSGIATGNTVRKASAPTTPQLTPRDSPNTSTARDESPPGAADDKKTEAKDSATNASNGNVVKESAVTAGKIDEVKARPVVALLLDHGVAVNAVDDDLCTALHFAARFGAAGLCELLLSHKADAGALNVAGQCPLDLVAPADAVTRRVVHAATPMTAQLSRATSAPPPRAVTDGDMSSSTSLHQLRFAGSEAMTGSAGGIKPVRVYGSGYAPSCTCFEAIEGLLGLPELTFSPAQRRDFLAMLRHHVTARLRDDAAPSKKVPGLTEDHVAAVAWYTSDVLCVGADSSRNGWFRMNALLRKRDTDRLAPFRPLVYFLHAALAVLGTAQEGWLNEPSSPGRAIPEQSSLPASSSSPPPPLYPPPPSHADPVAGVPHAPPPAYDGLAGSAALKRPGAGGDGGADLSDTHTSSGSFDSFVALRQSVSCTASVPAEAAAPLAATSSSPVRPGVTLWRGLCGVRLAELTSLHKGNEVCWPAFTSASANKSTCLEFLARGNAKDAAVGSTLIKIVGARAPSLEALSLAHGESEHLLGVNSVFRVKLAFSAEDCADMPGIHLPPGLDLVVLEQRDTPDFAALGATASGGGDDDEALPA